METLTLKKSLYIVFFILVVAGFSAFIGLSACNQDLADGGSGDGSGDGADKGYTWKELTDSAAWPSRSDIRVVLKGSEFYILGGHSSSNRMNDVWKSSDGITWTEMGNAAWPARNGHRTVVKGDSIYLSGGHTPTHANDVWKSSDGVTWTNISAHDATSTTKWSGRFYHEMVVKDDKLYVMGGNNTTFLNDVWESSDDGVTWTQLTANAAWPPRKKHKVVVKDGEFYVMGGQGAAIYNDVWKSSDGISWTEVTENAQWPARYAYEALVKDGEFYVMGGEGEVLHNDVWKSSDGISWTEITGTPWSKRANHQALLRGDNIYLFAGSSISDVWVYSKD